MDLSLKIIKQLFEIILFIGFHQGIIDYVYSNDSDLILLGVDLITNVNTSGTCWFMSFEGLKQRMSTLVNCNNRGEDHGAGGGSACSGRSEESGRQLWRREILTD